MTKVKEEKKTGNIPAENAQAIVIGHLFATLASDLKHASQMFEKIGNGESITYEDLFADEKQAKQSKKRLRDPAAPPKAKTAYMLFCDDRRPLLKEKNIPFPQQSKLLANEWKDLSENAKQKYNDKASKDKSRYVLAMKDYESGQPSTPAPIPESSDEEEEDESPSKRRKVDSDDEVKESSDEESPSPKDKKGKDKQVQKPKEKDVKAKDVKDAKGKEKSKEKPKPKEEPKKEEPKKKESSSQDKKETPKAKKN